MKTPRPDPIEHPQHTVAEAGDSAKKETITDVGIPIIFLIAIVIVFAHALGLI